jgi:hypothetical protein
MILFYLYGSIFITVATFYVPQTVFSLDSVKNNKSIDLLSYKLLSNTVMSATLIVFLPINIRDSNVKHKYEILLPLNQHNTLRK